MSLKDTWTPQDTTMDASPDIPNMLADAIIQNEEDIADLKENGVGSSDVFAIQWDGSTGDKTFDEIVAAYNEGKNVYLKATLSDVEWVLPLGGINTSKILFNTVSYLISAQAQVNPDNVWTIFMKDLVSKEDLSDIETALDNVIAIQNSLIGGESE